MKMKNKVMMVMVGLAVATFSLPTVANESGDSHKGWKNLPLQEAFRSAKAKCKSFSDKSKKSNCFNQLTNYLNGFTVSSGVSTNAN